ncbi:low affinity copper transporter [Paraphaeosphaeria sporulosa]
MDATNRTSLNTAGASFGLFTDWPLRNAINYGITILLLFTLGFFGRFLGTVKWQLERSWRLAQRNTNKDDNDYVDFREDHGESEPLSPDESIVGLEKRRHRRQFWVAGEGRNMKQDGIRALLEFARAAIAYILMLAVMTYDVGFFFSIGGSVLAGEFLLGRYSR